MTMQAWPEQQTTPRPTTRPGFLVQPVHTRGDCRGLMVAVADRSDIETALVQAAGRASVERRPLLLVVVSPAGPLTTDPTVYLLAGRSRAREAVELARSAQEVCERLGVELHSTIQLVRPVGLTRRRRGGALQRRLEALARRAGAELHPVVPGECAHGSGHR